MEQEPINPPASRSWRDIPQPVKPRAMSRGGRWRRWLAGARVTAVIALVGALGWGAWIVAQSLRQNSPAMPAVAKSVPVRAPELRTTRDGVLDHAWLARALALPPRVSLMELDLQQLRERVLADGQVLTASLTRQFPDRLIVHVTERTPIARLRIERSGISHDLLVARDGVIFAGSGFDRGMLDTLPWLAGISLNADGRGFRPIPRMSVVSQLLTDAQLAAEHLYRSWQNVSLARLETDQELEVTTKDNTTIVFTAKSGFFVQLSKLDALLEKLGPGPRGRTRIDLTFGREVPVRVEPLEPFVAPAPAPGRTPVVTNAASFHGFLRSSSNTQREL